MIRTPIALLLLTGVMANAQSVTIQNPGFENALLTENIGTGPFCNLIAGSSFFPLGGSLANWTAASDTSNAWAGAFDQSNVTRWWPGNNYGYISMSGSGTVSLSQTLTATLQSDTTYTLTALVSNTSVSSYALQLWAGSTLLASGGHLTTGTIANDSITYTSGVSNPQAGQPLMVSFVSHGEAAGLSGLGFDNVALNAVTTAPPVITTGGVVPVFSPATTIQPGSWISIYGSNLAPTTAIWNGDFPTSLGGTTVSINGKSAYIWFVSPTQINVQAPDDTSTGSVPVTVTSAGGSATSSVTLGAYGPSFSLLNARYPAALVITSGAGNSGGGYDLIGPAGAFSFTTRPVKAGETLILYGVGFGPTTSPVPAGHVFSGAATVPVLPQVTIGGVPAKVTFTGIVEEGLYQINLVVPSVSSGDQPLQAMIGGLSTPGTVMLTVQ